MLFDLFYHFKSLISHFLSMRITYLLVHVHQNPQILAFNFSFNPLPLHYCLHTLYHLDSHMQNSLREHHVSFEFLISHGHATNMCFEFLHSNHLFLILFTSYNLTSRNLYMIIQLLFKLYYLVYIVSLGIKFINSNISIFIIAINTISPFQVSQSQLVFHQHHLSLEKSAYTHTEYLDSNPLHFVNLVSVVFKNTFTHCLFSELFYLMYMFPQSCISIYAGHEHISRSISRIDLNCIIETLPPQLYIAMFSARSE